MHKKDLLFEIGTEELPPKSLPRLASALANAVQRGLQEQGLEHGACCWYATPRRLAVAVQGLACAQQDQQSLRRGPAVAAAFDGDGNPTPAAQGFARSCGVSVEQLTRLETDKGSWLAYEHLARGAPTEKLLPDIIGQALGGLPISKRMRWGDRDIEFVRPVHWAVLLFGEDVVNASVLGAPTGRETRGHRYHHPAAIALGNAGEYADRLRAEGYVLADFEERKAYIRQAVTAVAQAAGGQALIDEDLLEEVTALVEWPVALSGSFDEQFLKLPKEALIATMQSHQKYFPVVRPDTGALAAEFITVANIDSAAPDVIKQGNERVIQPRLSDAAFFWERDRSQPLENYAEKLDKVIFEQKLGTLAERTKRIETLGKYIAQQLEFDSGLVARAARLAKCDLLSDMVGEFPALQGIMGRYYALECDEHPEVARALEEQYRPVYAGAALPETNTGMVLALADKLDTLTGIFAIGKGPTGAKDPFGLRRAGLGCLRIMIECALPLNLEACLARAAAGFPASVNAPAAVTEVFDFMLERLRRYYLDNGVSAGVFDAVHACRPPQPYDFNLRVLATGAFLRLPEADSLVRANKRISNILKQAQYTDAAPVDEALLVEKTEQELYRQMRISGAVEDGVSGDYVARLSALASLRDYVDAFFDEVMVMCDDAALKTNRLALLSALRQLFLSTADVSRLQ